jgi:hypothetical protein
MVMVAGDVINDIQSAATLTFQPAAGVEIVVMFVAADINGYAGLTNGTIIGKTRSQTGSTATPAMGQAMNLKLCIDNDIYLHTEATTGITAFSGIQIK